MSVWCQRRPHDAYRRRPAFPDEADFFEAVVRPGADFAGADLTTAAFFFAAAGDFFEAVVAVWVTVAFLPALGDALVLATAFLWAGVALDTGFEAALDARVGEAALAAAFAAGLAGTAFADAFATGFADALATGFAAAFTDGFAAVPVAFRVCVAGAPAGVWAFNAGVTAFTLARPCIFGATTTGGFGCLNTWRNRSWSIPGR